MGSLMCVARCQWWLQSPEALAETRASVAKWRTHRPGRLVPAGDWRLDWLEALATHMDRSAGLLRYLCGVTAASPQGENQETKMKADSLTRLLLSYSPGTQTNCDSVWEGASEGRESSERPAITKPVQKIRLRKFKYAH